MTPEQFATLATQGYNRIPVFRQVLADLDTPLSAYLKLADGAYTYLFESVTGGEKWGRYSIIGLPCKTVVRVSGDRIEVSVDDNVTETHQTDDPLGWIEDFQARYRVADVAGLPRFFGGLVGYFGYDTVRYVEPKLGDCPNPDPLGNPDILLMLSEEVVVFDNLSGKLLVVVLVDPSADQTLAQADTRLDELVQQLRSGVIEPSPAHTLKAVSETDFISGFTREGYEAAVGRIKDYIVEGDAMQVVLSQRLSIPFQARPLDLYRALRTLNPSPYMY
ncbi:MAG TPA: anthranilate synthase component I, partial [Chromatiaceae bacterium]|nr:anthranilate synthase component I [Chromatiaceae bacterium]